MADHKQDNQTVVIIRDTDGVIWVTLNRPDRLNTFNDEMLDELQSALCIGGNDPEAKALVITGAGQDAFCMGSDLNFLNEAFKSREFGLFRNYLVKLSDLFFTIEELSIPVVAMVQGRARAAGFEMMLACDFVFVAEEAIIGDVHTPFGHIPGAGSTYRLAWKIGPQRALQILMTGEWLSASEAVKYGISIGSAKRDALQVCVKTFLSKLTDKPRDCLTHIKRCTVRARDMPARAAVELEWKTYIEYLATSLEPLEQFRANQERLRSKQRGSPERAINMASE